MLEENQDTNQQLQESSPVDAQGTSVPKSPLPPASSPAPAEVKGGPAAGLEPQTQNQKLETEMEVHKHPHHVTHKKKWNEYALEFFMLFLAVFLGFLAENLREREVEKQREKQFIASLAKDLQLDVAWLDSVSNSARRRIQNLDSAILFLAHTTTNEIPVSVYQNLQKSTVQIMFFANNGTVTELKSSGGMRLIENRAAVDSISAYDRLMRRLDTRREITNQLTHDFAEVLSKSISGKDLVNLIYDSGSFVRNTTRTGNIKLESQYTNELINKSVMVRLRAVSDINVDNDIKNSAITLINFLKKQYHLE